MDCHIWQQKENNMKVLGILLILICLIISMFTNGLGIILILLALIPASIAKKKGRDFWTWYVYSILLWIIAIIHSIVLKPDRTNIEQKKITDEDLKKCTFCGELINREATVCRFCGRDTNQRTSSFVHINSINNEKTWKCLKCGCATNPDCSNWCKECNTPRYTMDNITEDQKSVIKEYIDKISTSQNFEEALQIQKSYFTTNSLVYLTVLVPDVKDFNELYEYKKKLQDILILKNQEETKTNINDSNNIKTSNPDDISIQLQKLKDLFENQLIDEHEYKLKKAKILEL
jgi:energy-coupling factor transporter transmembrane protein EcfT